MKKIVFKPGPVFLDTCNGERKSTDMVVIGIRGSLYQKCFGYVIRNIITSEIMTIDVRFWPSNWVCNVFTEYKEEK